MKMLLKKSVCSSVFPTSDHREITVDLSSKEKVISPRIFRWKGVYRNNVILNYRLCKAVFSAVSLIMNELIRP